MDTRTLIDNIVRQTTVLIAQISTAAGVRSPLAHVADQIFVDLSQEIERQGVRQKVVADMFGLALRSYQKKTQRLTQSGTEQDRTLWQAVCEFVTSSGPVTRNRLAERFANDDEKDLGAVLKDLVESGLLYSTGRGATAVYGVVTEREGAVAQNQAASDFVCLVVFRDGPMTAKDVCVRLNYDEQIVKESLSTLLSDGRVEEVEPGCYRAARFVIPVGASVGWEAAVFDHFQSVATAIATKIAQQRLSSRSDDRVGGATLSFDICEGHPHATEVRALLTETRERLNLLWDNVEAHNAAHPIESSALERVSFYFGQNVQREVEEPNGDDDE